MLENNDNNPYAPPKSPAAAVVVPQNLGEPRVDGDCIVVHSGTALPMRCITTNAKCDLTNQRLRKLSYAPSFRIVLSRRICRVHCCMSEAPRKRQLVIWLFVYLFAFAGLWLFCGMIIVAGIFALIAIAAVPPDRLKITSYRDGEFWIKGLPKNFLEALVVEDGWKRV